MSRFEKATRPYDIQPTLMDVNSDLTILVGSIIGRTHISGSEIITQFLR